MARQTVKTPEGERIAIVSGLRTPFARQCTAFTQLSALDLGKMVVGELLQRTEIAPELIEQVVYGQVIQMPEAPNIAREIVLGTGMAAGTDAFSVTRACATGFQTVVCVAQSIMAGDIDTGIAGGADSTSVLPIGVSKKLAAFLLAMSKAKSPRDKLSLLRSFPVHDLLPVSLPIAEYSTGLSMGQTAEQMAKTYGISREEQDDFAHRSHQLASRAWQDGKLNEEVMTAYPPPYKQSLEQDNNIRHQSELESYARLSPVFDRQFGSVTAGNSTPMTDGAAAVLMMREGRAKALGLPVLGYIRSYAFSAIPVQKDMLMGPVQSIPLALERAGVTLADISLIEMHEAFAAQTLANIQVLSKTVGEIDMDSFNVSGGSIAYGHPFAATGIRLIVQVLREMKRRDGTLALAATCAAGGLGGALILETD